MSNTSNHLKALLKKNFILFKRSKCLSCCEILVPILLVFILVAIRALVTIDDKPETSYVDDGVQFYASPTFPTINTLEEAIVPPVGLLYLFNHMKNCADGTKGGLIALSPPPSEQNMVTEVLAAKLTVFPGLKIRYFNTTHDMDDYITDDNYGADSNEHQRLCLGVVVDSDGQGHYSYGLRFNSSNNNDEIYNTISQTPITKPFVKEDFSDANLFIDSGFLAFQNWIDNIILEIETKSAKSSISPILASLKTPTYKKDDIAIYLQGQTNIFLVLPLILPYVIMIYRLVYEKEKKIREGMKMMGMTDLSFYLSWCITYLVIYTILCVVNASILVTAVFKHSNWFFIFLFLWIFCIVLIFQSFFVSVFFTRAKYAIVGGIVFFYILYIINSIVQTTNDVTFEVKQQASLSSHAAMAFAAETILFLETNSLGLTADTINTMVNNYKIQTFFAFEFLDLVIFVILSLYLDQVFPNEFGRKKHPLFFINWLWKKKHHDNKNKIKEPLLGGKILNIDDDLEVQDNASIIEPVDATLKQQETDDQALLIKNLVKVYPNGKRAVENLSLNMYQNQIFVLLGHNGAGKTTTISMLTGLIDATSGTASVFGLDINEDMEELRKKMGVCPQHDILFDNLTVEDHLNLFATFKGTDPKEIPEEVNKMIIAVDLQAKRFDLSKNLSGGQKRRLSVAIAFIGNSKIILLDEPTSGMDTSARRYIWEMLKDYKNDRIVILTTHFMDEADFLGDRIAIMGEGMLKCVGSSVFLKNKFGVGYNLIIVKKNSDPSPDLEKLVFSFIPNAKCISRVAAELSFQLPLKDLANFKELFIALDENIEEMGIASYGISITTLEEVFLKVAEGTDISHSKFQRRQSLDKVDDFQLSSVKIKSSVMIFFVHFWAMIIKRLNYFKRDKKGLVCEIILPCLVITLGLCLTFIHFIYPSPALELVPSLLKTPIQTPVQANYQSFYTSNFPGNYYSYKEMSGNNQTNVYAFDDFAFQQRNVDDGGLYGAYFINNSIATNIQNVYYAFYNSTTPASTSIFMSQMNQAIIRNLTSKDITIKCVNYPFPLTASQKTITGTATGFIASFIFAVALAFIPSSIVVFIVKEREQGVKHQQLVSGVGLFAYWMANYVADFIKIVIPICFAGLMCLAFDITSLVDPSSSYAAVWLLLIFYGASVISFAYLVSFLFKAYGTAQAFTFVFTFLISAIGSLVVFIFRLIPSTRNGAKVVQFFLRIFAPFSFGFGILNVANRVTYAFIEGYYVPKNAFDYDIAAWDMIFMAFESVIYMLLVFLIEKLSTIPKVLKLFSREESVPFENVATDEDVDEEAKKIASMTPKDYAVYVKDLRKVFMLEKGKKKVAVNRLSFGIQNGECFGLLGVNGAGKTTTFKMLCGEIPPSSGTAYINAHDVTQELTQARENIGYCPQFDALLENLTAKEHLYLYAAIKGIPANLRDKLVEKQLQEMNLKRYENVCAGTYSGGNKRKLSVAIAMLGNPPIVFLDEPSTGMDPEARRFMWNVINRISTLRKRSCIILTTHSMEEAEALSTRISIMVNGNLKCLGSVQHIKNKFGQGYEIEIKTVLPDAPLIDELLVKIKRQRGERIFMNDLQPILQTLDKMAYMETLQPGKSGANLVLEMNKNTGLSIDILLEYLIIEGYGSHILHFLKSEFGSFILLEHFQSFYRIKLNVEVSVGKLFGAFEEFKKQLNIAQYSIKQATIEQIFNMFAKEQDNELAEFQNVVIEEGEPQAPVPNLRNSVLGEFEQEARKSLVKPYEIKDN